MGSSRISSRRRCPAPLIGSTGTRASRSVTTSTAATSAAPSSVRRGARPGEVYNLGGGRENSCSILEAVALIEELGGPRLRYEYVDEPRRGDHICYISDLRKLKAHYPGWEVTISLREILSEIIEGWTTRRREDA